MLETRTKSKSTYAALCEVIPGGVNSGARAFRGLDMTPLVVASAQGDTLTDVDGHSYLDLHASFGPLICGHSHPAVLDAVTRQLPHGLGYGMSCPLEEQLARRVVEWVPSIDKVRFVASGTEATLTAARLARGYTSRPLIVKFAGCYHGHADFFLVNAGSGVANLNQASSAGVPPELVASTICLPYNDPQAVRDAFRTHAERIAAVIVEPIAGNMGVVPGTPEFLQTLRDETRQSGSLLIFDEVISGFRVARGGAQELYNITPDLTCLGKILGGGFPIGAFGGRHDIMDHLYPIGDVYQAGTLSGNPIAMAAGLATLDLLSKPNFYAELDQKAAVFAEPLVNLPNVCLNRVGSMLTLFIGTTSVKNFSDVQALDPAHFRDFFRHLFDNGVFLPPSQFETWFISSVHCDTELHRAQNLILNFLTP
jgi:glutamate-1-semialdehyde 2,1-aminomutase